MISPSLTAVIQVYYHERREYLPRIIDALLRGSLVPSRIIVWDNGGLDPEWFRQKYLEDRPDVDLITSSVNTLLGRYCAALMCGTEYVFVQDDDLVVGPKTIERLMERAFLDRYHIAGAFGVDFGNDPEHPYTSGHAVASGPCDMVLGRAFLCHREALIPGMTKVLQGWDPGRADDIVFSGLARAWAVPCDTTNLHEQGIGLCHSESHLPERDTASVLLLRELSLKT